MAEQPPKPTDAELEILSILWDTGPATVRDVFEILSKRRATQYSTVLKFFQIMTEKGLVRRDDSQRAHVYETARTREWTQHQLVSHLLDRAFAGSAKDLVLGALSTRRASKEELTEIQNLLKQFRSEDFK